MASDQDADRPTTDFSEAVGEAGHESHDLGWEDVSDSAPPLKDAGEAGLGETEVEEDTVESWPAD